MRVVLGSDERRGETEALVAVAMGNGSPVLLIFQKKLEV